MKLKDLKKYNDLIKKVIKTEYMPVILTILDIDKKEQITLRDYALNKIEQSLVSIDTKTRKKTLTQFGKSVTDYEKNNIKLDESIESQVHKLSLYRNNLDKIFFLGESDQKSQIQRVINEQRYGEFAQSSIQFSEITVELKDTIRNLRIDKKKDSIQIKKLKAEVKEKNEQIKNLTAKKRKFNLMNKMKKVLNEKNINELFDLPQKERIDKVYKLISKRFPIPLGTEANIKKTLKRYTKADKLNELKNTFGDKS